MSRRKPHNSSSTPSPSLHKGQLGLPTPERVNHYSDGYETKQLAVGHDREGGVIQSRERAILTHPQLLSELYNLVIQEYAKRGDELPARVEIKQTPADRATAGQRGVLWSYITTHLEVLRGDIRIGDYEGSPRSSDLHRLPSAVKDNKRFNRHRFYAWVREQTGLAVITDFLDRVAIHDNPGFADDASKVLKKWDIGRWLLGKEVYCQNQDCRVHIMPPMPTHCRVCGSPLHNRDRDAENAFYGALGLAARALSEAAHDFVTVERNEYRAGTLASIKKIA